PLRPKQLSSRRPLSKVRFCNLVCHVDGVEKQMVSVTVEMPKLFRNAEALQINPGVVGRTPGSARVPLDPLLAPSRNLKTEQLVRKISCFPFICNKNCPPTEQVVRFLGRMHE